MFAQINLAGSSHFQQFGPGTKKECQQWLDTTSQEYIEIGNLLTSTLPRLILTNKEAEKEKYRSGSHVFKYFEYLDY